MVPTAPTLSSPAIAVVPSPSLYDSSERPWNRVYHELAPGSKPNNMAAVMEINVSPQIDHLTNSMDFYEEKRLDIWKISVILSWRKFSDVGVDWRKSESMIWKRDGFEAADDLWLRFVLKKKTRGGPDDSNLRWVVLKTYLVTIAIATNPMRWVRWETTRTRNVNFHPLRVVYNRAAYVFCIPIRLPLDYKFPKDGVQSHPKTTVFYEPSWKLGVYFQACRRCFRGDQTKVVRTRHFWSKPWA